MEFIGRAAVVLMLAATAAWLPAQTTENQGPRKRESDWVRLDGGTATVYSNAGGKSARESLRQILATELVFESLHRPLPERRPPLRIYLFRTGREFRQFRDEEYSKGFYQSGPDFDAISLIAGDASSMRAARHEAIHRACHRTLGPLPDWLEEGLAEVYSTIVIEKDRAVAGRAIESHMARLRAGDRLSSQRVLELARNLASATSGEEVNLYYAQCWAAVHLLRFGEPDAAKFRTFLDRLTAGEPVDAVLFSLYGRGAAEMLEEAPRKIQNTRFAVETVRLARETRDGELRLAPLDESAAREALADLYRAVGMREKADEAYRGAFEDSPESAGKSMSLGLAALRAGNDGDAESSFRHAIELGSKDPATYFELAMLLRDRRGPDAEVERLLRRTLELNSAHPEAWYLLGSMEERRGRETQAAVYYGNAVQTLPRQFMFREALARAYQRMGRKDEALAQVSVALACAKNERERSMAEGLMWLLTQETPATPPPKPAAKQEEPLPKVEGRLVKIDCGAEIRFHVETDSGLIVLSARSPADIRMKGRSGEREFTCGDQAKPALIAAEYRASPAGARVVTMEFK